ncbi:MAG: hypothetical protein ACRDDZ_05860 [Marinifilaceae bacterium]
MSSGAVVSLTEDNLVEIERLSSLGYSTEEMALYFDVDKIAFDDAANTDGTDINYHIRRGLLITKAKEQMAIQQSAEHGDEKAIKALSAVRYRREFNIARRDILYNCEVSEDVYRRLENFIQAGKLDDLSTDEQLYIETLTIVNSMRRKYGRSATIKFLQSKPFNLPYARARDMYEHAINLFYTDNKVEKKALRNLKAQQLEDAADMLLRVAKEPADFEVYAKLIKQSAEIRQLHLPDPPEVPKGVFDKPIKIFALDPNAIGIAKPDRNALARQIDTIPGATEADKRRAAMDAGVIQPNIDEYLESNED